MTRKELAEKLFYEGYACSQAIVLAFSDLLDIEKKQLKKISLPFGGGIGRLRLTCGALSGMIMVVGLLFSNEEDLENNKLQTYERVRYLFNQFSEKYNTTSCLELLKQGNENVEVGGNPEKRTEEYYKKRPCGKIVYSSALLLEKYLLEEGIINSLEIGGNI